MLAACFSLIVLVWRWAGDDRIPRRAVGLASKLRLPWFMPLSDEERKALKPPIFLAPSALAAVVIVRFGLITVE